MNYIWKQFFHTRETSHQSLKTVASTHQKQGRNGVNAKRIVPRLQQHGVVRCGKTVHAFRSFNLTY